MFFYICASSMKKILSIVLLFAIAFNVFAKVFLCVNYVANKAEITRKYCENKAKPKMHCDGKCHLKKQLKKEEKKESVPASQDKNEQLETLFFAEFKSNLHHQIIKSSNHQIVYLSFFSHSHTHAVFSPPKC